MNVAEPFDLETRAPDHSHFSYPEEVVESQILKPEEKRRILLQWLEDEKALCVADDEGMHGNRPTQIEQVHQAERLGKRGLREPGYPGSR